ncbi:hypothetical protein HY643_03085 [Candidatus Woesearchaeota archaeon]|nr:hypothetical protein [Candidatus Woesearchaeota archaeon]
MRNLKKSKKHTEVILYASTFSIIIFLVFGIITSLIPTNFFARMTPPTSLDYTFLILTSILLGTYISLYKYQKKYSTKTCTVAAYSGGASGFLGFGCAVCNKILILLLGVTGVLAYVEPYKPIFGLVGVTLLSYAVYIKSKNILRD